MATWSDKDRTAGGMVVLLVGAIIFGALAYVKWGALAGCAVAGFLVVLAWVRGDASSVRVDDAGREHGQKISDEDRRAHLDAAGRS